MSLSSLPFPEISAALNAPIVSVIHEALMDAPEIAQSVAGLHSILRGPRARRDFHAIDVGHRNNLPSAHSAAVQIELQVGRHIVGRGIDRSCRTHQNVPIRIGSHAVIVIKRGGLAGSRLEICRSLARHHDGLDR